MLTYDQHYVNITHISIFFLSILLCGPLGDWGRWPCPKGTSLTDELREGLYAQGIRPAFPHLLRAACPQDEGFYFTSCGMLSSACGYKCSSGRMNLMPREIITGHRISHIFRLNFINNKLYTLITPLADICISQLVLFLVVEWHGERV